MQKQKRRTGNDNISRYPYAWRELPSSNGRLLFPKADVKKAFGHEFSSWLDSGLMAVWAKIRISERELGHQWGKSPPWVWINHQYWQIKLEGGLLMIQCWGRKGFGFFGTHTGGGGRQEEAVPSLERVWEMDDACRKLPCHWARRMAPAPL